MKILAFDTSTKYLSVAGLENEKVLFEFHKPVCISHSEILIPTIKQVVEKLGWAIKDIELIAVGVGPGSFTGLRIGIAAVKGIFAVRAVKVVGVPSMDAIAAN